MSENADNRGAQALRAYLKTTSTTQVELARKAGISQAQLSRLAGGVRLADRKHGLALRDHVGIELAWWDEAPLPETASPPSETPTRAVG